MQLAYAAAITLHGLDDRLFLAVNGLARQTPWLHAIIAGYATYGVVAFGLLLVAGLGVARRTPALAAAGWAALAPLVAVGLNQPIGALVAEARPYATHDHLLVLAVRTHDFSFPSDHAVMAGATAAGLMLVSRRLGLIAAGAAMVMAVARVYIAAHYPWDVLAGLALGAGVAALGWLMFRSPLTAVTERLRNMVGLRGAFAEDARKTVMTSVLQ